MTTLTITTVKGATVELTAGAHGLVSADVNGKPHSLGGAVGYSDGHITLAGKVRAQVGLGDIAAVEAFFAEAASVNAAWLRAESAKFDASAEGFSAEMHARMYGRNSSH